MITHMVMRKDYEVARYQRLTKPLIELSDDVVDIDNFALPLKKNWFLELLTQKQRIGIYERFLQLIKNISSILALFYKNHPNLKILHISVGGSYCYSDHKPMDIDFNFIVEGSFFSYYDIFINDMKEVFFDPSIKKISFMIFGYDNLRGKTCINDSILSRSFLHTDMTIREGVIMPARNITIYGRIFKNTPVKDFNFFTRILRQLFQAELLLKNEIGLEYEPRQRLLKAFSRICEAGILLADSSKERKKWLNSSINDLDLNYFCSLLKQTTKGKLNMMTLQIISPSKSAFSLTDEKKQKSIDSLKKYFKEITFSKYFSEKPTHGISGSISHRVEDLNNAFKNSNIDVIMAYSGGFDCNKLLDLIDWNSIKKNPKIFCGMSDITVLCNAIFAKTGIVTFLGPVFSQFATFNDNIHDFSVESFYKMLMNHKMVIPTSKIWSNDRWITQEEKNSDHFIFLNKKDFSGTLIGGNLSSFDLLFQTPYMPKANKIVLLLEEDDHICSMPNGMWPDLFFERELTHITQMDFFPKVQAILIGRFKKESHIISKKIKKIIQNNTKLKNLPVFYGLDFGHTNPVLTLPIGGLCRYSVEKDEISVSF